MPLDELFARRQRLDNIRKQGLDPYPSLVARTHTLEQALEDFTDLQKNSSKITVCGRVMAIRKHGGSLFFRLRDNGFDLQAYCKKDVLGAEDYQTISNYDVGDYLEIFGTLFLTHKGEKTILAMRMPRLLSKALRPLPEKWHGLSDTETRYRKRYLDLLMNANVRAAHLIRSQIITALRKFLEERGFVEVETPVLQSIPGGAAARPFLTHLNSLDIDLYLRVAPELYLKRLLVGGFNKIFEVARCFRNEGMDHAHNPEFTMIELYEAYANYTDLMKLVESLMTYLTVSINGSSEIIYDQQKINFAPPYAVKDWLAVLETAIDEPVSQMSDDNLRVVLAKRGVDLAPADGRGAMLDKAYKKFVRPKIVQPTFLINHPLCLSPLAKQSKEYPDRVERFQLIVGGGLELVNGFTELNDPMEQRVRFEEQERLRERGDEEAQRIDHDFIEALEYGMPPAAGLGIGLDRLVALLTNRHSLKEIILFPTIRPK